MPEDLEAGNAYLQLMASAQGLQSDVSKKVRKVKAPDIVAQIDAQISKLEAKAVKARQVIDGVKKSAGDPQIGLDIAELEAKAAVVRERLTALRGMEATAKVQADIATAEAQLGRFENRLNALEYKRSTARVEADTAAAEADLRTIESQVSRLNGRRAQVQLDAAGGAATLGTLTAVDQKRARVDGSNASVNIAAAGGAQASGMLGAIVAGLAAVASASPAAAAGLATVLSAGTGAVQAAGAVSAGFSGIGDAIKSVEADEKSAATTSAGSSASRVSNAGQVASAHAALAAAVAQANRTAITGSEAVADAARAEARAAIQADRARITSAQQVAAARRALADAEVSAADRVSSAERSVGAAQESVRYAQEALTAARRDAAEANEDLQLSLSGIAISERRAVLAQKKAQAALAKGSSDPIQQEELQLNVDEAAQNLAEIRERYGDLKQQQAEFAKGGVEGSAQVVAASRSVRSAQQSEEDAQRSLVQARRDGARQVQDAVLAVAQAEQQASWSVQDAQQGQQDAARATARAARDAAWAQEDAARGVSDAQRALQQALQSTAGTAGGTGAAVKKSAYDLAQLTPAGRDFVAFWTGSWKPAMQDVTNSVAGELLPRIQTSMANLLGLQPELKKGLSGTGAVLGDLAVEGSNLATSPAFRRDFSAIMDSNNRSLHSWGEAGLYGVDATRALTVAGLPLSERLARVAEYSMQGVDSFLLQKEATGELGTFMGFAGDKAGQLFSVTGDLIGAALQLGMAIAPVGSVVLDLVGGTAQLVGEFAQANPGMIQFAAACGIGLASINGLAKATVALKAGAQLSWTGISTLGGGLATALNPRALASTTAMQRLANSGATVGALMGSVTSSVTGSATAMGTGAARGMAFTSTLSKIGSALPLIGAVLVGAAAGMDAMGTSTDEATAALAKGGAQAAAMRAELAATDAKTGETGVTIGNLGNSLTGGIMKFLGFETSTKEATAALEDQRAKMSNLERAQSLATEAQGNYEQAVRQFGAASPQAVAALGDLNTKTRDVEIAQVAVREKTDLATAAVLYQRDQILAGLDANLRARLAAQQLAKDQDALAQAIGRYGAGSQQAKDAGLQLEQSQRRQAEAAKSSAGGQQAYVDSIKRMVGATKGELTPTLAGLVGSLSRTELAAMGATVSIDGTGRAVATLPGGKTVVLDANTSPAMMGMDGVIAKLNGVPPGKTINVGVLDLPAQQALQAIGFTVTTLPNGQVTVTANDAQARATLLAFQWYADAVRTNPTIAANPQVARDTLAGFINKANTEVGIPGLSSNPAEANRIVDERLRTFNNSWSTLPIAGDAKKATDAANAAKGGISDPNRQPTIRPNVDPGLIEGWWGRFKSGFWTWLKNPLTGGFSNGGLVARAGGGLVEAYATGGRVQGFPTGGGVRGPGTATSDSIPALLSDGEYVIRAAAVQRVGVPALDAINAMRDGGPVDPVRLAVGGSVRPYTGAAAPAAPAAAPAPAAASGAEVTAVPVGPDGSAMPTEQVAALATQLVALTAATAAQQTADAALAAQQTGQTVPSLAGTQTAALALVAAGLTPLTMAHLPLQAANNQSAAVTAATWAQQLATVVASRTGQSTQQQVLQATLAALGLTQQQTASTTGVAWSAQQTAVNASTAGQNAAMAGLRAGMGQTGAAVTGLADGATGQFARMRAAAADPIRFVIQGPVGGLVDAFNRINADFGLGRPGVARPAAAFAEGSEDHRAQIARGAGPVRVWAEPETGGEAYIPLAASKRDRSTAILGSVASEFGYDLAPRRVHAYADGGVFDFKPMLEPYVKPARDGAAAARARYAGRAGDLGARGVEVKADQTVAALAKKIEEMAAAGMGPLGAGAPFYTREIVRAAMVRGLGVQGATIGVATALVESAMRMYANTAVPASLSFPHDAVGHDHDSVGLFQQRQAGWGTLAQRMNAFGSASLFFNRLQGFNWRAMAPGAAAQKVQVSAFPGRYQTQMGRARALIGQYTGMHNGGIVKGVGNADTVPTMLTPGERVLPVREARSYDTASQLLGRRGVRVALGDQAHARDTGRAGTTFNQTFSDGTTVREGFEAANYQRARGRFAGAHS